MQPDQHTHKPDLPDPDENAGVTILLVDDDPAILEGVVDLLQFYGYEVLTASDGRDGLEMMGQVTPDLVISDIMMPEMDGFAFYEQVRQNPFWATVPFIFLTARGQAVDVRRGQKLGADAYLVKPFEPEDLIIAVQARLRRMREIQQAAEAHVEVMKQQLMTIFSHELRTPLTYIYGYVNLLQEGQGTLDPQALSRMLEGVRKGADRLVRMVEDLMLLIKIDSGLLSEEFGTMRGPIDLGWVLSDSVEALAHEASEKGVAVTLEPFSSLRVDGIDIYLQDIFRRLVGNAIKFSPRDRGLVTVRMGADDRMAWASIEDNGVGISRADQKRVFDRFVQINRAEMEQQGIGLGLALVHELVNLHRGRVEITSALQEGSTFTVRLPLAT